MKRLKHKVTGVIYRWTPVMAAMKIMEEIDMPVGPPPTERKKPRKKAKVKKPVVPEVSLDDLNFEDLEGDGELSD